MTTATEHPLAIRMRAFGVNLHALLVRRERKILLWSIGIFTLLISAIGAWKIWSLAYNGLDLAIYNQVAWNSVHGRLFEFTIHPHSYLGDHFEIAFAVLFPIYAIIQHPLTLVVIQALAIASAVIPLSRIAARFVGRPWHLLFALAFLGNPTIQNMALYEFHMLPFAIPLVSWALLRYLEQKYWQFILWSALALTVREDVAFVIIGFAFLGLIDRRAWKWWVAPLLIGGAWLFLSLKLSSILNDYGQYKFLVYYAWLGDSVPNIILGAIQHPLRVIQHLLTLQNLGFLAGLLLPFGFLPIFRVRWMIPAGLTLLQLMLAVSSGELLIEIHYPALIIPFLVVASAATFERILHPPERGLFRTIGSERIMATVIFIVVIAYSMLVIGPFAKSVSALTSTAKISERVRLEREISDSVAGRSVVTGFEQITHLSQQERLFSLHYILLGNKQFSDVPYILPDDAEVILFDQRDALIYHLLYEEQDMNHEAGYERVRRLLSERGFVATKYIDRFVVYEKRVTPNVDTYSVTTATRPAIRSTHDEISFLNWSTPTGKLETQDEQIQKNTYRILPLQLTFMKTQAEDDILQLELRLTENNALRYRTLMPFGGGIYPTSDWKLQEAVTSLHRPLIPDYLSGKKLDAEIRVLRLKGDVVLNGVRSLVLRYNQYETVGAPITLGQFEIGR